jgi:hypothetical protein
VSSGRPLKDAVTGTLPVRDVRMDSIAPVIVVSRGLMVLVEVLEVLEVLVVLVLDEVRVPASYEYARELLTPGEQPTKFGADSFTALHDAMLKAIAPVTISTGSCSAGKTDLLCWSGGAHEVAKQQESALTYAEFVHKHFTSIPVHSV